MADGHGNGVIARLEALQRSVDKLEKRVGDNEKTIAGVRFIERAVERIDENCDKTREWVDEQFEAKEKEERDRRVGSRRERLTAWGLAIMLAGVLVSAVAALAAAGAFN